MKHLLIFCFVLGSLISFSQVIEEVEVPKEVVAAFKKKNARVKEKTWIKTKDTYQVKFLQNARKAIFEYSKTGELILTRMEIDEKKLLPPIETSIAESYGNLRRESAYLITKGKEKYYSINLYEKGNKKKRTELQYTTSGQFITAWEPEIIIEEEVFENDKFNENTKDDNNKIRKSEVSGSTISTKELPTAALKYLSDNYNTDWNTRQCIIAETPDGLQYYVVMKRRGQRETWEHYFDINGNLVSKDKVE